MIWISVVPEPGTPACLPPLPDYLDENISTLKSMISAPLLGVVPVLPMPVAGQVNITLQATG